LPLKDHATFVLVLGFTNVFLSFQEWLDLESAVQSGPVPGFGKKLGYIVDVHLQE